MRRLGEIRLPPLSATANVVNQIYRQILPGSTNANHDQQHQAERVHFAQLPNQNQNHSGDQNHSGGHVERLEMGSMKGGTNPFLSEPDGGVVQGYQTQPQTQPQQRRMSSMDFSEGSDFVEGKSEVKINEYQAAWNVTNAIQVILIHL
ncbi:unnamed protein product [Phaedon cochleariae]|uniref:Uncharacterized protein n=1 Tax=Phaedon cochleariae TaxID=80249 RepID=A0A9N9SHF9_PHACE|nr:unnamed protein product [Phaedon cochleariae]